MKRERGGGEIRKRERVGGGGDAFFHCVREEGERVCEVGPIDISTVVGPTYVPSLCYTSF